MWPNFTSWAIFLISGLNIKRLSPGGLPGYSGALPNVTDKGIPVHFFTGNHDLWVFDYLPQETGLKVHRNEFVTEIWGKKFFLAHGDGLDPDDKGYLFLKKCSPVKNYSGFLHGFIPNFAFQIAHRWSKSSRLSKMDRKEEFNVKNENMFRFAEKYLEKEWIDYFIFGHRHRMADVEVKNHSRMILLGDWINNFSYGVFDGEKMTLKKFDREIS
jgi:UDP-2,3-diacylglucosamine hydrolase